MATLNDLLGPEGEGVEEWAKAAKARRKTSDRLTRPAWAPPLQWDGVTARASEDRTIMIHSWNATSLRDVYAAEAAGKIAEISAAAAKGPVVLQEHRFDRTGSQQLQDRLPMAKVLAVPAIDQDNRHARAGIAFVVPTQLGI